MRQYTGNGRVAGYAGAIDLDYFRGERWQWDAYARGDVANVSAPGKPNTGGNTSHSVCVMVKPGDTLSGIAARTGLLPWQSWHGYKSGNPAMIYPGETVCHAGGAAVQPNTMRTHTVAPGESLWSVFGADWARVASLNGLSNPSLIYPGQILRY
jgi:LysM repeat protein